MLENKDEIVLDSTNNVFVGPDEYFKVVIDEFDGQVVKSWHVEDVNGNKTPNLADRAQGKNIDLMINVKNRTVAHFVSRYQVNLLTEQQAQIQKLSAANAAPATEAPAAAPAPAKSSGVPVAVPVGIAVVAIAIIAYQASRNKDKGNNS
ncbi:hypothetical protein Desdi_0871 [Desulfitobacterium dichloroeliminans LMG P-21439]|uniref:Uncharacterized protein n=1 Tax=Desulfitobacterium dichloroeliminans (strain LMG P-21439 / DCA1) TaxID=871963 RepID=L0F3H6_DESDL|nr:hypothetical protein [Desulfitobacterium dichloroeliminans]AGA68394.1 hypothetical protein Desdi_0871 [Desulfitobacterium dichloroeliminans LMG P-21439]